MTKPLADPAGSKAPNGRSRLVPSGAPNDPYLAELRQQVLTELQAVSGSVELASKLNPVDAKEQLRKAHASQRSARLSDAAEWLTTHEATLLDHFADGSDVVPSLIDPVVTPVRTPQDADLFKFATLQWSVPVSSGYGRRTRFLVRDRFNGKLIAVFALGDPVIAQGARDSAIGWDKANRNAKLYNVYDAFVLGAVEPYRQLLAGKLAALLTLSNEVRDFLTDKYSDNSVGIRGEARVKDPTPVLITTSSALGRSSVYNRVTYEGSVMLHSVGFTKGFGHFQFSDQLFAQLLEFVRQDVLDDPTAKVGSSKWGSGPNWRFRVIRTALNALDIPDDALNHNVKREVFLAPTAVGWDEYLRGERADYMPFDLPTEKIGQYYRDRWAVGRAERRPEYQFWRKEEGRLTTHLAGRQLMLGVPSGPIYGRVDLGAYSLAVGTGKRHLGKRVVNGKVVAASGTAYLSRLEGNGFSMTLADVVWDNGDREIFGYDSAVPKPLALLNERAQIKIAPAGRFRKMAALDLSVVRRRGTGVGAVPASPDSLADALGFDLAESLDKLSEGIVGTRGRLLKDKGPTTDQMCVVFDEDDRVLPAVVWALTRPISLLRAIDEDRPRPVQPALRRRAPRFEELILDD